MVTLCPPFSFQRSGAELMAVDQVSADALKKPVEMGN